jgi:transcriptional regulator with XRE-family HTH domain
MLKDNLTKYRTKQNLSKLRLSKLSGISRETIKQIEKGKENVRINTLEKLAKPLKVTVKDLIK